MTTPAQSSCARNEALGTTPHQRRARGKGAPTTQDEMRVTNGALPAEDTDAQRGVSPPHRHPHGRRKGAESKRTGAKDCTAMLRRLHGRRARKTTGPDRSPPTRAALHVAHEDQHHAVQEDSRTHTKADASTKLQSPHLLKWNGASPARENDAAAPNTKAKFAATPRRIPVGERRNLETSTRKKSAGEKRRRKREDSNRDKRCDAPPRGASGT
ncbi:hypothetical protein C8J57DRAFT_1250300 [Mycena rebaudengoi]|nr:hypothetical protein C8J57DRAFT_1250300 [Mycena rebaudengoi]